MRVAMVPLDSRPANWQFPQRLAEIAEIELVLPRRADLGGLHGGANGLQLAHWLVGASGVCDAVVFSWDALIYGGLIQSRDPNGATHQPADIAKVLARIDWTATAGYCYLTVPRLGISVDSQTSYSTHQQVREYFIANGSKDQQCDIEKRTKAAEKLGIQTVERLWDWRARNQANTLAALDASAALGLSHCHIAVEDNATRGPHLDEVAQLRARRLALLRERYAIKITDFDGADECACMLLAKAVGEHSELPQPSIQLAGFPDVPPVEEYTGLYESRTLGDGLSFLEKLLGLDYVNSNGGSQWLLARGVFPQPDAFAADPETIFNNPYLLPERISGDQPLLLTDLAACNGGNPHLAVKLAEIAGDRLVAIVGFNTNFNSVGLSAALLLIGCYRYKTPQFKRFALERLADDVVYQSIARPKVIDFAKAHKADPMDFGASSAEIGSQCSIIVRNTWQAWIAGPGAVVLDALGLSRSSAQKLEFSFPWHRAFEIEAVAPA